MSKIISDEQLQRITGQIFIGQGILAGYELGVFGLISKHPMSIKSIAGSLGLHVRATQAIISCASSLNLVEYKKEGYELSDVGKVFLNEKSPSFYGEVFDLLIQENELMNYLNIKQALVTNQSQANNRKPLFNEENSVANTENFIKALHKKAFQSAFYWTNMYPLLNHKKFIDIGGGSGIHSIAACLQNKNLSATVCDRPSVIPFTNSYIKDFNLNNRINTKSLNMWENIFPQGDIYFFGDIFHDWNREKCYNLATKCYKALPQGGKILLHEMLFNNKKTGPFLTAGYNMKMITWTEGQQFSKYEIKIILRKAGFKKIQMLKVLGNWSLIIGIKF